MFKHFGKYVEQDDPLNMSSTVRELFEFAASMHLKLDPQERDARVNKLINILGLEECQHTPIGGKGII